TLTLPAVQQSHDPVSGLYDNATSLSEKLELRPDGSFALRENGRDYEGRYEISGATITLRIPRVKSVAATFTDPNTIVDREGKRWVRQVPSALQEMKKAEQLAL